MILFEVDDHTLGAGRSPNDITYWVAQLRLGYKYSITHLH